MITIPPSLGMLLSLIVGVAIGEYDMNRRMDSKQKTADSKQIVADNQKGAEIAKKTAEMKDSSPVAASVIKYRTKTIKVPRDLTDEEIDNLCTNRYIPTDLLQLVRHQIAAARERIDNVRDQRY